ncbi:MAG: autotransporter-associated beta strand repeat-containing protein [Thermoguttaceae bacterium]
MRFRVRTIGSLLALSVMVLGLHGGTALGDVYTWTGATGDGVWGTTGNWAGGVAAPVDGTYTDAATLAVSYTSGSRALTYSADQGHTTYANTTAGAGLLVKAGAFNITGGTFEVAGSTYDQLGTTTGNGTMTVSGGGTYLNTSTAANVLVMQYSGNTKAALNVNDGGLVAVNTLRMNMQGGATSTGSATATIRSGGTLSTNAVYEKSGSGITSQLYFYGGTFQARNANAYIGMAGGAVGLLDSVKLYGSSAGGTTTGGVIFDSNGYNITVLNALAYGTAAGCVTKVGEGTLTLGAGLTNTYWGATTVNAGKLVVNGSIDRSSGVILAAGATLGGTGSVTTISGAGSVGPGNSPGILTASNIDPSAGTDFSFELTAAAPTYSSGTANSSNDVLRLTGVTHSQNVTANVSPITSALTSDNVVDVYFGLSSLAAGDSFLGGFYEDGATDFTSMISGASYNFFVLGDGAGTHAYNGVNYYTLAEYNAGLSVDVATVASSAEFVAGTTVNGGVTQFTVAAVPEPATAVMLLGGLLGLVAYAWRKRK